LSWQLARLACPGKEFGSYLSGNGPILIHQIQRELALPTTKYQPRPDPRARALPLSPQFMPHNQQFIGVLNSKGLNAHEGRGDYDRVVSVRRKGIRANKPWQSLTALSTEAHVMAKFLDCSPRFSTAQDVTLRRLLELDRQAWATIDAAFAKASHRSRWKRKPQ